MIKFVLFIFVSSVYSMTVVTIKDSVFTQKDFFKKYGKAEWDRGDNKQKKRMLDDYIKRESCAIEAVSLGFLNDPSLAVKLKSRSKMVMVNSVYEELVAKPLVPSEVLAQAKKHIKSEINVYHILIGHQGSRLPSPPKRTKDEAFLLAQNIKGKFENGTKFEVLAKKHSDDPSSEKNGGDLGWVGWGRTTPSFQEAAFELGVNNISKPVSTEFGYHLILVKEKRNSEYSEFDGEELELVAYNSSRGAVSHLLRDAATDFDTKQISAAQVQYNNVALEKILNLISEERNRKKITGKYNVDLVSLFETSEDIGVVCVYNKKGFGLKWFANKLKSTPVSRHPNITNIENIQSAFDIILLQDIAVKQGYEKNINNKRTYIDQINTMKNSLLYDTYLKWLVNSAPKPDSTKIVDYYNNNKEKDYVEPIKVVVKEIKVLNKALADSLLLELEFGLDFESAASIFSKTNPGSGGLIKPFEKGKYNEMGEVAFSLNPGEISNVIENLDRSFSIIKVEKFIPKKYSDLKKVYTRIESLLMRKAQSEAKDIGVNGLYDKLNIVVNKEFFDYDKLD